MKDAYTFDRDEDGLDASYEVQRQAYHRIFQRCGLEYYEVEADVGMMGGSGAHEFMAPCPAGENDVALAPGYAANVEVASAEPRPVPALRDGLAGELHTPGRPPCARWPARSRSRRATSSRRSRSSRPGGATSSCSSAATTGSTRSSSPTPSASPSARPGRTSCTRPGAISGPPRTRRPSYDAAVTPGRYVAGGNRADHHQVIEVTAGERLDVRTVEAGDTVDGHAITIEPAIEVGNIFKLGTRYSVPLGATYLDESGKEHPIVMGSYGIGPARIAAAAVEQYADDRGISWPRAIAPVAGRARGPGQGGRPERAAAEQVYAELREAGLDVLFDDRDAGPGRSSRTRSSSGSRCA
jgi:prolyl-tRNA synthetase